MKNLTLEKFKTMFESIQLSKNDICNNCDAKVKHPLLPWIVGSQFNETKEKVLFVGKPHRGEPGERLPSGILDSTKPHLDFLINCKWPYWSYTKSIAMGLFGDNDPWDYVAFTNIIKCTNVTGENGSFDTTSKKMAKCCIDDNGVIFSEIEELKPNCIVFFTYDLFSEHLVNLPFAFKIDEITKKGNRVPCGMKTIGWWHRRIKTEWSDNVSILVTHHPERKKKSDYVNLILNWIKKETIANSSL